jgi:hypothetical protein
MGMKPGPTYRTILEKLRSAWLDDLIKTPEKEKELLEMLLKNMRDEKAS